MDVIEELVKSGIMGEEQATEKIDKMRNQLKGMGVADESVDTIIQQKVREFITATKRGLSRYTGLCIGVTESRDILEGIRNKALALYKENPTKAIQEGIVKVEGGTVIAIDNRPSFPGGNANKGYGKPIGTAYRRSAVLVGDSGLVVVTGSFGELKKLSKYVFWGQVGNDGQITGAKSFVELGSEQDPQQIWEQTYKACEQSDLSVDMDKLKSTNNNRVIATIGFVETAGPMQNGGMFATLVDYESGTEVICFAPSVTTIPEHCRAIVVGRKYTVKDRDTQEEKVALDTIALVPDPSSVLSVDITQAVETILLED